MLSRVEAGGVWRLGANKSTTFKTSADLAFGDVTVPKGEYSLWARREADNTWKLVFNKQHGCMIMPNPDPQAASYCYNPNGTIRKDPELRAVFGYFRCDKLGDYATTEDVPRTALAPKLKLVQ